MQKILQSLILMIFLSFTFTTSVLAADLNINCQPAPIGCSTSGLDPLFSSIDGFWYPGKTITRTINLRNSDNIARGMALKAQRIGAAGIIEDIMSISITSLDGSVLWSGSLNNFYGQNKISLGTLDANSGSDYNLIASMSLSAGNEYQDQLSNFDLSLGFWEETGLVSSESPIPEPGSSTPSDFSNQLSVTPGRQVSSGTLRRFPQGALGVQSSTALPANPENSPGILGTTEQLSDAQTGFSLASLLGKLGWLFLMPLAVFVFLIFIFLR